MIVSCSRCDILKGVVFNHRAEFQDVTETRNPEGDIIETWTTVRTVRADVKDMRGFERLRADQELAERVRIFKVRWFSGLHAKMRVLNDGMVWDIEGIAEIGRRVLIEVTTKAVRA